MATTKQIPRRRMIAALAISGRPGVKDGKPPQPRHRRRRSAQLVWRRRPPVASRPVPEPRERGSCSAASSSTTRGRLRGIAHRRPGRARHARRPSDDPTVSRRRTQPASSGLRRHLRARPSAAPPPAPTTESAEKATTFYVLGVLLRPVIDRHHHDADERSDRMASAATHQFVDRRPPPVRPYSAALARNSPSNGTSGPPPFRLQRTLSPSRAPSTRSATALLAKRSDSP
jgi:hypothetical protein